MFKNYFKIASRYLLQNKGYSIVNILGLAIGITCCILIMLFVRSEWSFDSFHTKSDRIYRAWLFEDYGDQKFTNTQTPIPLGPTLQANIPEIEEACRVYVFNTLVQKEADKFNEPINMVDTNFFKVFDFKILKGNNTNPFQNSNSIVITTSTQNKYFSNNSDVIGQTLDIQMGAEKKTFLITAVTSDPPKESSIQFKFLIPHSNEKLLFRERNITSGWTNVFLETYVLARTGVSGKAIEAKIPGVAKKISGDNYKAGEYNIFFQPITDIHLNKKLPAGNEPISDPFYSYILATLGLLILIIACINFITLSIGQSAKRAKEVGVRKVMGALRPQLISQFWGEAIIVILTAFIISIALSFILLKPFNEIANKSLTLSFDGFNLSFCISIILLVSLAAGVYPAVILSGFVPVQVLKGKLQSAVGIGLFRKGLIVAQFVASIIMIISTLVISQQLNFIRNKNLGYDKEHIVVVPTNKSRAEGLKLAELFRNELKNIPQVLNSTTSIYSMTESAWINLGYEDDNKVYRNFNMNAIDADFIPTFNLELKQGRNFIQGNTADEAESMIVNEALVKEYNWQDPIGQKLPGRFNQRVIGVVKDFNYESLHNHIQPLVFAMKPDSMLRHSNDADFPFAPQPRISIKLSAGNLQNQISSIKNAWTMVAGDQDFEYKFLDASLNSLYQAESRLGSIVNYASLLSIFIACMGLFGLVTLVVTRRTKEIGIRKVLGANTQGLIGLISKEFIVMVILAAFIAFPLSWIALHQWLQDFVYRVDIHWWVFAMAGGGTIIIAFVTVCIQAVRAAMANPVNTLRSE